VERTQAWITAHRHRARDYEWLPERDEAMVVWAMTALMTHRLAAQAPDPINHTATNYLANVR
jgi:hypothetical protein